MLQVEQAETATAKLEEEARQTRATRATGRRATTPINVPEWNNAIHSDFLAECAALHVNNWQLWKVWKKEKRVVEGEVD